MSSAVHPALTVAEVVEGILLQCDMKTLLVSAQRVCRGWHAVAQGPAVQTYLFFKEDPCQRAPVRNPLLREFFPHWFPREDATNNNITSDNLETLPAAQPERLEAFKHKNASWRQMLIQQPPIKSFTRWVETSCMGGPTLSAYSVPQGNQIEIKRDKSKEAHGASIILPDLEESPSVRMGAFYKLVTGDRGPVSSRMFVWNHTNNWESEVEKRLYGLQRNQLPIFQEFLKRDGLVFIQNVVVQCTGGNPWRLKRIYTLLNLE